jgi:hypothetical protein
VIVATVVHRIQVQQGAAFKMNVAAQNADKSAMNLAGYSARMQVRASAADPSILMEASTANGYITINAPGGIVMINVPATITGAMTWTDGVWDLEISTSTTDVIRLAEGFASLSPEVTR